MNDFSMRSMLGNFNYDFAYSGAIGKLGGILCVWDPSLFVKQNVSCSNYFVFFECIWKPYNIDLMLISIYAPHDLREK